ncbi:MAG: metallophosphoesterase [Dehalococcoidia bacterium]
MEVLKSCAAGAVQPSFTFAVVADTHINESDATSTSPFETNRLANARARYVFECLSQMRPSPSFVVHLGDIVHPIPSHPRYDDAAREYQALTARLPVPIYLTPGNHDVGDKRINWMPADQVCTSYLEKYRSTFSKDWYSFQFADVRFIVINSLLINSGLEEEQQQQRWLENEIAAADRAFLFTHYPPYIYQQDEAGNYDNIDEPGRSWLLRTIKQGKVEAVFAGHVHNFWYDGIGDTHFYMLPSTAFLRHDFTEFYKVKPSDEFGRGEVEKFGFFLVDVYADHHVAHSLRTMGRMLDRSEPLPSLPASHLAHPSTSTFGEVGVELRHPWAETLQIPATGGVQEFGRKWARNDYPLLALMEMGVRLCKVPEGDVLDPSTHRRMTQMARLGQRYLVTSLRSAERLAQAALEQSGVIGVEVNATWDEFCSQNERWKSFREKSGIGLYLSLLGASSAEEHSASHFAHSIRAGFSISDLDSFAEALRIGRSNGQIDGVTVRIEADDDIAAASSILAGFRERTGCELIASLKTSAPLLSEELVDDARLLYRTVQAMLLSKVHKGIKFVFDTFMDVDRGYFPRQAFVDRKSNPRAAANGFRVVNSLCSSARNVELLTSSASQTRFVIDGSEHVLLLVDSERVPDGLTQFAHRRVSVLDLENGSPYSAAETDADRAPRHAPEGSRVLLVNVH